MDAIRIVLNTWDVGDTLDIWDTSICNTHGLNLINFVNSLCVIVSTGSRFL